MATAHVFMCRSTVNGHITLTGCNLSHLAYPTKEPISLASLRFKASKPMTETKFQVGDRVIVNKQVLDVWSDRIGWTGIVVETPPGRALGLIYVKYDNIDMIPAGHRHVSISLIGNNKKYMDSNDAEYYSAITESTPEKI